MLWDLAEGKRLYVLDAGDIIHCLVFSPNRYWLCAATQKGIKIWDLESKTLVGSEGGNQGHVTHMHIPLRLIKQAAVLVLIKQADVLSPFRTASLCSGRGPAPRLHTSPTPSPHLPHTSGRGPAPRLPKDLWQARH